MSIPDEWKVASVVPFTKKGSKSDVQNYRPISLTCIIMKAMDRIVRDELRERSHMTSAAEGEGVSKC